MAEKMQRYKNKKALHLLQGFFYYLMEFFADICRGNVGVEGFEPPTLCL